jgi:hypothetical protein
MIDPDQINFMVKIGLAAMGVIYGWPFVVMCVQYAKAFLF